ncbi:DUF488 domain-containing protein [Tsukamurella sp. 8F]|uniref:DUF488 domain-containing protein n=1 Tax=unclassified Tsukamurella TaxID=2633480 RepID=UPI0023B89E9D|nr:MULTISPECIES: DUF488 domain-containing protein [unclassified Tsukamurella]MDF0529142.1 DUF488 domain-containing protein [Tsukamurella sp. 8J]MDF0585327.1 DUF488 domain-containing protein [Tsukamurella sp. 8F]
MGEVRLKRVYEPADDGDGYRVLVDRLWPRGVTKERAALDLWSKDVAPSPELRKWWSHDPARFAEFRVRYDAELCDPRPDQAAALEELRGAIAAHDVVTLAFGAHDPEVNHAVVLRDFLLSSAG